MDVLRFCVVMESRFRTTIWFAREAYNKASKEERLEIREGILKAFDQIVTTVTDNMGRIEDPGLRQDLRALQAVLSDLMSVFLSDCSALERALDHGSIITDLQEQITVQ